MSEYLDGCVMVVNLLSNTIADNMVSLINVAVSWLHVII